MVGKTIRNGNATIIVYRPTLTEEEKKKRETQLALALQECGKALERGKNGSKKIHA